MKFKNKIIISCNTISVLAFPPRESCNKRVSFELRYGTCDALPSANEEITFPNVESDQLIFEASLSRRPDAPLFVCLSLPAKSTWETDSYFNLKFKRKPDKKISHQIKSSDMKVIVAIYSFFTALNRYSKYCMWAWAVNVHLCRSHRTYTTRY